MRIISLSFFLLIFISTLGYSGNKVYVGSKACSNCHQEEYEHWQSYAKKAHSFEAVKRMEDDLTPEEMRQCYKCHTTGYGEPGGFKDAISTPGLKNVGCEVCHGPGSLHIKTSDPKDIKTKITLKDCEHCHVSERIRAFGFRPLLHAGAH